MTITTSPPLQYHAIGLLYHIRKSDRLAVIKLVSKFSKHTLKSPYAYCLLIRIASKLMKEDESGLVFILYHFNLHIYIYLCVP